MSLATGPVRFTRASDNYAATPSATPGTAFTAGGGAADGAEVTCLSALAHDVHFLRLRINGMFGTGNDVNAVGDLLVDPAGGTTYAALINDICCGFTNSNTIGVPLTYEFPIYIAAGTSVGWRAKSQHTVDVTTGNIVVEAFGEPSNPAMWWCGQGVDTLGASGARGTAITAANSGAAGTWTNVGTTTAHHFKSVQLGVNGSDNSSLSVSYHFEVGHGSAKLPGSGTSWASYTTTELGYHHTPPPVGCSIPVGTQMQARGTCSGVAEVIYVSIYGVF